uniref:Homeobox domain-containing protein n=1 Tax=Ananas comosus var. bracteatus TaxID=296719 RepID=A0A6V7QXH2_ANACO
MATYFHGGPDIQTDSLQTLYLMNPAYVGYSDASAAAAAPANMVLFNPAVNPMNPMSFAYSPAAAGQEPIRSPHPPPPTIGASPTTSRRSTASSPGASRLSLSLSSREMSVSAAEATPNSGAPNATAAAAQSFLMGSKYLKAAQQLLDEMVNVGKGGRAAHDAAAGKGKSEDSDGGAEAGAVSGGGGQEEASAKRAAAELSTAEKQELQMKKAKLVNMLDEVEQRYRQYHHQMQIVISSFEAVAGRGSARTYTALALQTISKQFRCLRDAITGQIRATSKSLGEENAKTVGSRLRFVDHHLRQQRALQQLGMMQHNAWRPQRGLPERSVSILRAWLFEHFLHPYPKDSDKLMLAKQTGLTRSQVSNWFINARVRLWKPMVEEMYLEETKDHEQINNNNNNNNSNNSNSNTETGVENNSAENEPDAAPTARQETDAPKSARRGGGFKEKQSSAVPSYYDDDLSMRQQPKLKKLRSDEPVHAAIASSSHSIAGVDTKPNEMNNRALLMKFIESSGRSIGRSKATTR